MSPELRDLIRYRMSRARWTLANAKKLLDDEGPANSAVNRLYYATFYAISALLLAEGLSSKKHSGIRSLFGKHLVKTGRISRTAGDTYNLLFEARHVADYEDMVEYGQEQASDLLVQAEQVLDEVEDLLKSLGVLT